MNRRAMDPRELSKEVGSTAQRFAALVEEALRHDDANAPWLREALTELATGMEELRVAEEELVVQAEQLAASTMTIDAERERYAALFEFAPDGYVETDEHGKIVEANVAATRLLGVPARYLAGKLLHSFVAPDDRPMVRTRLAALTRQGEPDEVTVCIEPRDGPPRWAEIRAESHFDPVAKTTRVLWLIRDVSERMKLQHEIDALHVSVDLLSALSEVNRLVEGEEDAVSAVLARLVDLAAGSTSADAGVMLVGDDGVVAVRAVAGPAAADICEEQIRRGGPATLTQSDGRARIVPVEDMGAWPELARLALRHSVRGLICQPIRLDGMVKGTFNLYVRGDVGGAARMAELLADNAAATIANAQVYSGARNLAAHLATALESRGVIEQAKGILIAMQRCTADEAFDILRRSSQRQNRKLRAIAQEIVDKFAGQPKET